MKHESPPGGTPTSCLIIHPDLSRAGADFGPSLRAPEDQLQEAVGLAAAIHLKVLDAQIVRVNQVSPGHLIGKGHREELAQWIAEQTPEVVIVNHALSPVQQRNLEKEWKAKVIDRTGLILEIFGERAQSSEGKIQVELAALNYQRSRLVRSWTHLERQRGGTGGTGGPGETQLEIDRRLIDDKIARLKRELEEVRARRDLERAGRDKVPFPVVALVGYTNAGKSSLFNALTGAQVFAENLLFATLDPTLRRLDLPGGQVAILADTVGFISALPTHLIAAFRATLEQLQYAAVILHVRDVSAPDFAAQQRDVHEVMEDLGIDTDQDPRVIEVWNKIDALAEDDRLDKLARARHDPRVVMVSAQSGEGLDALKRKIEDVLSAQYQVCEFRMPLSDGKAQAWLHAHANVLEQTADENEMVLRVDIAPDLAQRFLAYHPAARAA